jgi:integrase
MRMTNLISVSDTIDLLSKTKKIKRSSERDYRKSCKYLNLLMVDLDNLPQMWKYLTARLDKQRGFCNHAHAVIRTMCKIHGIIPKGADYFAFVNLLKQNTKTVFAYTDDQVRLMIKASRSGFDFNYSTYKLLIVLTYTGARISSLSNVKLTDFKPVPKVDGIYYVNVVGKGKGEGYPYPVFLPKHVLDHLFEMCEEGKYNLTSWNPAQRSSFANYSRSALIRKLRNFAQTTQDKEEAQKVGELSINTSIFHSIRKNFAVRMSNEESLNKDSDTQSLLLGQKPNSLNYKVYVLSDGAKFDNVLLRMARAYAGTSIMELKMWQ